MIKQWDKYNSQKSLNPFNSIAQRIEKKGLLKENHQPIYHANDINKFLQKISIGKHR